jgi:hypothetical protein
MLLAAAFGLLRLRLFLKAEGLAWLASLLNSQLVGCFALFHVGGELYIELLETLKHGFRSLDPNRKHLQTDGLAEQL